MRSVPAFRSLFQVLRGAFRSVLRSSWFVLRSASAGAAVLAAQERPVFADQPLQVIALLVRELQEDLLALGVLEPLAVALEEAMRAALAADANLVRLAIVDAVAREVVGAFGEEAVR